MKSFDFFKYIKNNPLLMEGTQEDSAAKKVVQTITATKLPSPVLAKQGGGVEHSSYYDKGEAAKDLKFYTTGKYEETDSANQIWAWSQTLPGFSDKVGAMITGKTSDNRDAYWLILKTGKTNDPDGNSDGYIS